MKKIVYLPLDERPCNAAFPPMLLNENAEFFLVAPDANILSNKKTPADFNKISAFLFRECEGADCLILSLEMLLYGGLVPSRLHNLSLEALKARLGTLNELKRKYPQMKIYASALIMRCPQYNSDDEEPAYWATCGKNIFLYGEALDKQNLLGEKCENLHELKVSTETFLDDFLLRRKTNLALVKAAIDLIGNVVDFMVVPQDDSAPYGFTAIDRREVKAYIREKGKQLDCLNYPGADEVGLTLMARFINFVKGSPKVCIDYSSCLAPFIIPLYEDRPLGESVKMQLAAAGCERVLSECEAEFSLMVNAPSGKMAAATAAVGKEYETERSLAEFAIKIGNLLKAGKRVAVADVAYVNGGDNELAQCLERTDAAMRLAAYAGWNTSSNTLGTTIAQASLFCAFGDSKEHKQFLALRYFEDFGYCAYTRKYVCENELPKLGLNYFDAGEKEGEVAQIVKKTVTQRMAELMPSVAAEYEIERLSMPWKRMFETALTVREKKK